MILTSLKRLRQGTDNQLHRESSNIIWLLEGESGRLSTPLICYLLKSNVHFPSSPLKYISRRKFDITDVINVDEMYPCDGMEPQISQLVEVEVQERMIKLRTESSLPNTSRKQKLTSNQNVGFFIKNFSSKKYWNREASKGRSLYSDTWGIWPVVAYKIYGL